MATRFMCKALSTAALGIALSFVLAAPTTARPVRSNTVAQVFDPVGDAWFNAPAFQDVVFGQMTRTASGDFELLMEMAGPVPVNPPLPPPAQREMWWAWFFDVDSTVPLGTPFSPGEQRKAEFVVYVSWDGTDFAGTAIDRRPLLTGGDAIITPVPFSINGTTVEAFLDFTLIGDVPPSFRFVYETMDWSGPFGSAGHHIVDQAETIVSP